MRIGLLLPLNISIAPYLKIYTKILDRLPEVEYDIIYCDKRGKKEPAKHRFNLKTKDNVSRLQKLTYYFLYSRYLLHVLKKEKYDKLIVFGPQIAIFIQPYLCKHYKDKFIMDYRDLSIDRIFKKRYKKIVDASACNVISSPGFKEYLPEKDYILSHNFDIDIVERAIADVRTEPYTLTKKDGKYHVMTIGGIRHVEQNCEIIKALANNDKFQVTFAGWGFGVPALQKYVEDNHIKNVEFTGFYNKQDEPEIITQATYLNIYYSLEPNPRTAISNRFYNSIIYRKPMITTIGTIQRKYAADYNVGLAIKNADDLPHDLEQYYQNFDFKSYEEQRLKLLILFREDYQVFQNALIKFTKSSSL